MDPREEKKNHKLTGNLPILDLTMSNVESFEAHAQSKEFESMLHDFAVEERTEFSISGDESIVLRAGFLPESLSNYLWFDEITIIKNLRIHLEKTYTSGDSQSWLQHIVFTANDREYEIIDEPIGEQGAQVSYYNAYGEHATGFLPSGASIDLIRTLLETAVLKSLPDGTETNSVNSILDERFFQLLMTRKDYDNVSDLIMMLGASIETDRPTEKTITSVLPGDIDDQEIVLEMITTESARDNTVRINAYTSWGVTGNETEIVGATREVSGGKVSGVISHAVIRIPSIDPADMILTPPMHKIDREFTFVPNKSNAQQKLAAINHIETKIKQYLARYQG